MASKEGTPLYLGGYVPSKYTPQVSSAEIKQIPPYPDSGVAYAGYFKVDKGAKYDLFPQFRFNECFIVTPAAAVVVLVTLLKSQRLYITDIHITLSVDHIDNTIKIQQKASTGTKDIFLFQYPSDLEVGATVPVNYPIGSMHFSVPVLVKEFLQLDTNVTGDEFAITINGWVEND